QAHLVVVAMEIVGAFRDDFPLEILPGAAPDAIAGVDRRRAAHGLRAEIGPPGLAARARRLGEGLAALVGAFQPAEIGALTGAGAGDKEGHIGRLRLLRLLRPT